MVELSSRLAVDPRPDRRRDLVQAPDRLPSLLPLIPPDAADADDDIDVQETEVQHIQGPLTHQHPQGQPTVTPSHAASWRMDLVSAGHIRYQ